MAQYCSAEFTDALMAWNNDLGTHVEAGDHEGTYYFRLPDEWAGVIGDDFQAKIHIVARGMYESLTTGFGVRRRTLFYAGARGL
jgi:hypothetical protein